MTKKYISFTLQTMKEKEKENKAFNEFATRKEQENASNFVTNSCVSMSEF